MQSVAELIELLSIFEPTGFPVISLYLNAQPDEHGHDNYHTFVRNELRERAKTFAAGSPERESFDKDVERINSYLDTEIRPSANGIAVFACAGAGDFFETVQLDAPIENNRLFVFDQPHLYPLARLLDQYPRYAVLVANTNSARIFVFGRGAKLNSEEVKNRKTNRTKVGGWSQMRYQRHLANYHLHHAKEVIEVLERVVGDDRAEHIILAGDEVIIPLLREQMPAPLTDKVIDVVSLDINAPEHEIFATSMESLREHDSQSDAEKVSRLIDEYRGNGLAVVGVPNTLTALSNGQADDLLISAAPEAIKYDEAQVKKVLAAYSTADAEAGIDVSQPRLVADELVKRAQASAASVTFIEDASLLAEVGGVGAILRYRF
ncbi:MAG TPA: Vms1/Ankzf1 family peptidyl-tRNA hydrolase [Blastocatellia bacterium]|nr:Vms1/Ankzf1 family peptidyl-tRNA hydrolase [Blastocatellia bacterium]